MIVIIKFVLNMLHLNIVFEVNNCALIYSQTLTQQLVISILLEVTRYQYCHDKL